MSNPAGRDAEGESFEGISGTPHEEEEENAIMVMMHIHRVAIPLALLLLFSSLSPLSPPARASGLVEHLGFLAPLIGVDWAGGYIGDDSADLKITLRFSPILDGRAVEYTREVPEAEYSSVAHIYWDPQLEDVRFLSLNNRGTVGEGSVTMSGGEITFHGEEHLRSGSREFKTVLSISPAGVLRDVFLRREPGGWMEGHVQEFKRNK